MSVHRFTRAGLLGLAAILPAAALGGHTAHAAGGPGYARTSGTLHATGLGPNADQACDLVYDLYVPDQASAASPVPAILTTNGFGGSKTSQASVAAMFAQHGYEVLSYSGLGFGGSTCNIELDSPEWDGRAASRFVDLLAKRDEVAKDGADDPVLGTWGGSYGGGFQFALASVDPRVDAMIPLITWNDLAYSLAPNNDAPNRIYTASAAGVPKYQWTEVFFADGMAQPAINAGASGNPPTGCPGFDRFACTSNADTAARGYPSADTTAFLRHASAEYELFDNPSHPHVPPMMLIQGENDTLFNFNDAVANYNGAVRSGADVKLVFQEGGHSGPGAPGETNDQDVSRGYLDQLYLNWFNHYLKHDGTDTGARVEYFQDWVTYDHSGSAGAAYGRSGSYPVGDQKTYWLSGTGSLVDDPAAVVYGGTSTFANPPGGQPGSYSETSEVGQKAAPTDPPGESVAYTTAPLAADTDVVGIPEAQITLSSTTGSRVNDPADMAVIFGKIYDVAPDGSVSLVHGIVSPVRIGDPGKPVHINLPGQVHRYARGHSIRLVLAATDQAYTGSRVPDVITVRVDPSSPSTLTLPVAPPAPAANVPETPASAALLLLAAPAVAAAALLRRRRRASRGATG